MKSSGKLRAWLRLLLLIVLWSVAGPLSGQEVSVTVEPQPPVVNERFEVEFTLEGQGMQGFRPPEFPDAWRLIGGPVRGTQQSIVNGRVRIKQSFRYVFMASREGSFRLGPAYFQVGKKEVNSRPTEVKVLSAEEAAQAQARKKRMREQKIRNEARKKIFIRVTADKTRAYVGEQIRVSYKLYRALNLRQAKVEEAPQFAGFWTQELETQSENTRTTIRGETYVVTELKKAVLFPQKTGQLELDPFELQCVAVVPDNQRRDPFGGWGSIFGRTRDVSLIIRSKPMSIEVMPLPGGAPDGFQGLVGRYDWQVTYGPDTVTVGEGYNLNVELKGRGNLEAVQTFELNMPPSLEQYDPEVDMTARDRNGVWYGEKRWSYLFIPRQSGTYEIPKLRLVYFDPQEETYEVLEEPPRSFAVSRPDGVVATPGPEASPPVGNKVPTLQETIRDIARHPGSNKLVDRWRVDSRWFWAAWGTPMLLFLGGFWLRKQRPSSAPSSRKKAASHYQKQLRSLKGSDRNQQLSALENLMEAYLADTWSLNVRSQTREEMEKHMEALGFSHEVRQEWFHIQDQLAFLRYAPGSPGADIEQLTQRAAHWIEQTEGRA